uniref:(northern house mosquito) hypothetical protein n=1 Tax=Culex pipiens TaxID=7175 RepID=A0A8D8GQ42_CULPI
MICCCSCWVKSSSRPSAESELDDRVTLSRGFILASTVSSSSSLEQYGLCLVALQPSSSRAELLFCARSLPLLDASTLVLLTVLDCSSVGTFAVVLSPGNVPSVLSNRLLSPSPAVRPATTRLANRAVSASFCLIMFAYSSISRSTHGNRIISSSLSTPEENDPEPDLPEMR